MKIPPFQIENYIEKIAAEKIAGAVIFGPEPSVVVDRFEKIAKKISPDLSDPFLVSHLSKERLSEDPACLADEFYSFSMLGGRKLIIIKDCDVQAAAALKLLVAEKDFQQKSENFILIQAGDLEKHSSLRKQVEENQAFAAIACYEDDDRAIKKLIADELQKNQVEPNEEAVLCLFEKLGKNRQIIAAEIKKIATYLDGEEINNTLISRAIDNQAEISSDEFIDSFISKNYAKANEQAVYLLKHGFESITLMRFLSNYLQKIYNAKIAIESKESSFEEAVKAQKLFFKVEAQFRKHLKNTSLKTLVLWLKNLQELEIKIKTTSTISAKLLFLKFLQEGCVNLR